MITDSITSAAASISKEFGKKKRTNRTAKLKQCKLDARREQWLSKVKNNGCRGESEGIPESSMHKRNESNESNRSLENLEVRPRGGENDGSVHHDSDSESPANSPTSHISSILGSTDSGTNYHASSSSSSSSGGCCSGSITEEEEEEGNDECLDDWEADTGLGIEIHKPEHVGMVPRAPANGQAWRADDAFRPQSLPNLSKQHSFPMNSDRHYGHGGVPWARSSVAAIPISCPICYEDLDFTDSSFLPCSCGFRLCLFCHKRILEEDGRCPGCRKPYDCDPVEAEAIVNGGSLTFRLGRSYSMIARS
ncbi:unnamed protein product, partial [Vitis vinifera]